MTFLAPIKIWCWCCCFAALLLARPANGFAALPRPSVAHHLTNYCNCNYGCNDSPLRPWYKHQKWALYADNMKNDDDVIAGDDEEARLGESQQSLISSSKSNSAANPYSPTQIMSLMGTSPRRIFLSLAASTAIALSADLFGITSNLLTALPEEAVEKSGLDTFYPRGDYKRVTVRGNNGVGIATNSGKCSFLIPKEWVADTGLALAQAQRQARVLDYSMNSSSSDQQQQQQNVLPDAAYGPPGRLDSQGLSNGDTNVSVIINNGVRNFSLASSLGGDPTSAAEVLLSSKFGPRKPIKLVSAFEEERRGVDGDSNNAVPVYQFEYTVDRGEKAKPLRAISVVAGSLAGDAFVTMTVVSPDEEWENALVNKRLHRVAESFKLV